MSRAEKARAIVSSGRFVKRNFLASREDGARYWMYRVLRPLLKLYTHYQRSKFYPRPWLTPASIHVFDALLTPDMTGLEYGSGSSTLFFAARLGKLESIEHHPAWYEKVASMVKKSGLDHVSLHLVEQDKADSRSTELGIPGFEERKTYTDYFSKVNEYPDSHFDFILIDGRARVECTVMAIPKLKSGGILALDNSERKRYTPVFHLLSEWEMVQTTNGLTNTTIWFKP